MILQLTVVFATFAILTVGLVTGELTIVSKSDWKGEQTFGEPTKLNLPVKKVIIIHTASEGCDNRESCELKCRDIQIFHMNKNKFDDIGYNFLIGGDGLVYEGRGWDHQGAHTRTQNSQSIGIAFIGTFSRIVPTEAALSAAEQLIAEGVKLGKIDADYKLHGHRQFAHSESPGEKLLDIIKKWSHFSAA